MTLDALKLKLCKFGNPQVVKRGLVFTVFLTGENLTKWETVDKISRLSLECAGEKYPTIEVIKNEENFFLLF